MRNIESTKEYFNKNIKYFQTVKNSKQAEVLKYLASVLEPKLNGRVLDIGSGAKFPYPGERIDLLISMDISLKSLINTDINVKTDRVFFANADARVLPFKECIFDVGVLSNLIHHLCSDSVKETYMNVKNTLNECYRVLNKNGNIFIFEPFLSKSIEKMEKIIFPVTLQIIKSFHKPMVYFFSLQRMIDFIEEVGFDVIAASCIKCENARISPWTSGIDIPFKFTPFFFYLIEGLKRR